MGIENLFFQVRSPEFERGATQASRDAAASGIQSFSDAKQAAAQRALYARQLDLQEQAHKDAERHAQEQEKRQASEDAQRRRSAAHAAAAEVIKARGSHQEALSAARAIDPTFGIVDDQGGSQGEAVQRGELMAPTRQGPPRPTGPAGPPQSPEPAGRAPGGLEAARQGLRDMATGPQLDGAQREVATRTAEDRGIAPPTIGAKAPISPEPAGGDSADPGAYAAGAPPAALPAPKPPQAGIMPATRVAGDTRTAEQTPRGIQNLFRARNAQGDEIVLDPATQEANQRADWARRADAIAQDQNIPKEMRGAFAGLFRNGIGSEKGDTAAVQAGLGMMNADSRLTFAERMELEKLRNEGKLAAAAKRGHGGMTDAQGAAAADRAARLAMEKETKGLDVGRKVMDDLGFKDVHKQTMKYAQMRDNMSANLSKGQGYLDGAVAGAYVKEAQGGSGVLTTDDMNQFWNHIGDLGIRGESMLYEVLNGKIMPEKREAALQAIKQLYVTAQDKEKEVMGSVANFYEKSPNFGGSKEQVLSSYFPSYRTAASARNGGAASGPAHQPGDVDEIAKIRAGMKKPPPEEQRR